jgi:hypothetical protein
MYPNDIASIIAYSAIFGSGLGFLISLIILKRKHRRWLTFLILITILILGATHSERILNGYEYLSLPIVIVIFFVELITIIATLRWLLIQFVKLGLLPSPKPDSRYPPIKGILRDWWMRNK